MTQGRTVLQSRKVVVLKKALGRLVHISCSRNAWQALAQTCKEDHILRLQRGAFYNRIAYYGTYLGGRSMTLWECCKLSFLLDHVQAVSLMLFCLWIKNIDFMSF